MRRSSEKDTLYCWHALLRSTSALLPGVNGVNRVSALHSNHSGRNATPLHLTAAGHSASSRRASCLHGKRIVFMEPSNHSGSMSVAPTIGGGLLKQRTSNPCGVPENRMLSAGLAISPNPLHAGVTAGGYRRGGRRYSEGYAKGRTRALQNQSNSGANKGGAHRFLHAMRGKVHGPLSSLAGVAKNIHPQ